MYLDFDNEKFYNHHSDASCDFNSITKPIAHPDQGLTSYTVEVMDDKIMLCGGMKGSLLSNKCYLGDFEASTFAWEEFYLGVGMELPYMVAVGPKACH